MAVTFTTTLKNNMLDEIQALIDAGSGAGYLEIGTTSMASVLATITFSDPCAGAASSSTLTFSDFPKSDTSADNTGTAAEARIRDSDDNDVITGLTVGTADTDIIIDNTSIAAGQTVTVNSITIAF